MENKKPKILVALGSPSDKGLLEQARLYVDRDDIELYLSIASAHRTSETVEKHAKAEPWDAVIAGAGLTNKLAADYLEYIDLATVLIGLPIIDLATQGLSSVLSTVEQPPGYPIAAAKMDNLESALDNAIYLTTNQFKRIILFYDEKISSFNKAHDLLTKLEVPFNPVNITEFDKQNFEEKYHYPLILRTFYDPIGSSSEVIEKFNKLELVPHTGLKTTIVCHETPVTLSDIKHYILNLENFGANILYTGINNGKNLALYGAKVLARHNPELKERIANYIEEGKKKYEPYKELIRLDSAEKLDEVLMGGK